MDRSRPPRLSAEAAAAVAAAVAAAAAGLQRRLVAAGAALRHFDGLVVVAVACREWLVADPWNRLLASLDQEWHFVTTVVTLSKGESETMHGMAGDLSCS